MAEQAKALLQGNNRWKQTLEDEEWEDVGEMVEVEQDVEVPTLQR
jgi:large subunit ribosomal protein L23